LQRRRGQMPPERYARACARLEGALDRMLARADEPADEAARRLVKLLRQQRQRLFTFLCVAGVAPTNHAAERATRPAVIVRKTSAGNRSERGAQVQAVVTTLLRSPQPQVAPLVPVERPLIRSP